MKKLTNRVLLIFTLIIIMSWVFSGITVYGQPVMMLLDDGGSSPGSWNMPENRVASTSYLDGGPPSGNPGDYYYFTNTGGGRDVGSARIYRDAMFDANQKILSDLGQLKLDFSMDCYGWSDGTDNVTYKLYSLKEGAASLIYDPGQSFLFHLFWYPLGTSDIPVTQGADGIRIEIIVDRNDGSDLDVYVDNIKIYLYDTTLPIMNGATVTGIKDNNSNVLPLKKDASGNYLENWVNTTDTILGTVDFNEPVTIYNYTNQLYTNALDRSGSTIYGNVGNGSESYLYSHEYSIPLTGADKLKSGDSTVKFIDGPYAGWGWGPFSIPWYDYGGNYGLSNITMPNIDAYNIKLDNASPVITTPWNNYEGYVKGRTSVDIIVREENRGTVQSPLTMKYYWKYRNSSNVEVTEAEREIAVSSTVVPAVDDTYTTYTVKIDIPNGSNIPPYQDFWLYAEVEDEARNNLSGRVFLGKVNQKDTTPPAITWDNSAVEDTLYAKERTVSFSINDLESGVEEVRYLWTKEPYNEGTDSFDNIVQPGEDGKYSVQGTSSDAPLEGRYYLNIKSTNITGTSAVSSKGFYFDNESPRAGFLRADSDYNATEYVFGVSDRALQNKLLYAIAAYNDSTASYETVNPPDISGGLKDSGMWKVWNLNLITDTNGEATITGMLYKITQTGKYKLVTRYYDEFYNFTELGQEIYYDFITPTLEIIDAGSPETFQKNHDFAFRVIDNMSGANIGSEDFSAKWVEVSSGNEIAATIEQIIIPQVEGYQKITGSESFNGKYYLKVKMVDNAENIIEETVLVNGSRADFSFDNSPPEVTLAYNNEKSSRDISFSYSELKDAYTGVALFKYGISTTSGGEPSEWINITPASGSGEIVYPKAFAADGQWYLSVMLQDTLGNQKLIRQSEPFRIDVTNPAGRASFEKAYTNKLDVPLLLEIDELNGKGSAVFRTILSSEKAILEDEASLIQSTDWKDITYDNGSAIYSWKLSDTTDGEQRVYVRYMDEAGNLSGIYEAAIILDRAAPAGEITYGSSIAEPTNNDVTASLSMSDNYTFALLNNSQSSTYVFNRNGEFEFIFADEAGNKTRMKAEVSNIDKSPPKADITYSHPRDVWTNESITATLNLTDENGFTVLGDGAATHTFNENGEYLFEYEDKLGNKGSIKAVVKNIDKEAPVGSIIYTNSDTAPVTVYLSVNESVTVTNNEGSYRYLFDENGEFTFEFEDKAGNVGEAVASVYSITSLEKYVDVIYSDSGRLTNGKVEATFIPISDMARITEPTVTEEVYGSYSYSFSENGSLPVTFEIMSGENNGSFRTVTASVYNIDGILPSAEVFISSDIPINQPVAAEILTADDKGNAVTIMNNNGESEYIFEENGTFTFDFRDEAGNIVQKAITVDNIDKSVPKAVIRYFTEETRENVIFAEITFPGEAEGVEILNNNGSNIFEFVENGSFTFRYADKAGNIGTAVAQVSSLLGDVLEGSIKYYIEETEIADPNTGITNKSITAKLITDEANGPYRIINNGGSSSYVFEQNGEFTFAFEDSRGNRGFAAAKVSIIDKEAPRLNILADTVKATNKDVIVTITYSDNVGIAGVSLNENVIGTTPEGKFAYVFTENKAIQVTVVDTAGNETTKEFTVNYIDKEAPTAAIAYTPNSLTNQNVRAVLTLGELGSILNNNGKMEYVFLGNGDFIFEYQDIAGNRASKMASVNWIDKLPPAATIEYSNKAATNKPVEVTLKSNDDFTVINNGGAIKRTFYRNGEFTFRIVDNVGNETGITAVVGNIDTDKPEIVLKGLSYVSIFQDETYTEAGYSAIDNVDGDISGKVITEGSVNTGVPGIYVLKYKVSDAVGNSSEKSRTVKVIGSNEIVLLLNGGVADGDTAVLESTDVKVDVIGNEGSYKLMWAKDKRTQAYFKSEGNSIVAGVTVRLEAGSWYTFFVQDRESKTKSIKVYINE